MELDLQQHWCGTLLTENEDGTKHLVVVEESRVLDAQAGKAGTDSGDG